MDKPVIILGGGLWGSLLAYRLRESLPAVDFILYEDSSLLGRHESWSFRESDCGQALMWLKPLISHSWQEQKANLKRSQKSFLSSYHLINSRTLHEQLIKVLPKDSLRLNNKISAELALQEGAFVIDTREMCHYKKNGFKKYLTMEVELNHEHDIDAPVLFEQEVSPYFSYLPLSSKVLLVKQCWFSSSKHLNLEEMRKSMNEAFHILGWRLHKVIKEESGVAPLPLSAPVYRQEGRLINLAGLGHDTTGSLIPHATRLIDRMIKTSFRFGELKEVVTHYRSEIERDRKIFRYVNQLLVENKEGKLLETVHSSSGILERFSRGNLSLMDRSKILLGTSSKEVSGILNFFLTPSLPSGLPVRGPELSRK